MLREVHGADSPHRPAGSCIGGADSGIGLGAWDGSIMTARNRNETSPRGIIETWRRICRNPQTATASNLARSLNSALPTYRFLDTLSGSNLSPGPRIRQSDAGGAECARLYCQQPSSTKPGSHAKTCDIERLSNRLMKPSVCRFHKERNWSTSTTGSHCHSDQLKIGIRFTAFVDPEKAVSELVQSGRGDQRVPEHARKKARRKDDRIRQNSRMELSRISRQGYALDNEDGSMT